MLPVLGRTYLDDVDYATWALTMTVVVAAPIFDLGGSILVQSVGYRRAVSPGVVRRALALSAAGACAVTLVALGLTTLVRAGGSLSAGNEDLQLILVVAGIGSVVRSAWTVQMALLQTRQRFGVRAVSAAMQACTQVIICWAMLANGDGLWALPVSLCIASTVGLVIGHHGVRHGAGSIEVGQSTNSTRALASSRVVSALVGVVASQGDRWVLAAIATPTFLAKYDFALRLSSVPLGLAVTLFQGVTSESAVRHKAGERHALMVSSIRHIAAVVLAMSFITLTGVLVLWRVDALSVDGTVALITVAALLWMGVNALTAAPTYTYLGAGLPWAEIAYSLPCALTLVAGWLTVGAMGEPSLLPLVSVAAVSGWSLWFMARAWRDQRL